MLDWPDLGKGGKHRSYALGGADHNTTQVRLKDRIGDKSREFLRG